MSASDPLDGGYQNVDTLSVQENTFANRRKDQYLK